MNPKKNKAARRIRREKQKANELKMMENAVEKNIPCRKCVKELQKEFVAKILELDKEFLEKRSALLVERNNKADELRESMKASLSTEHNCSKHK